MESDLFESTVPTCLFLCLTANGTPAIVRGGSPVGAPQRKTESWCKAAVVREPAAVYDVEAEPVARWPREHGLERAEYSIRLPEPATATRCDRCQSRFSAAGPTGYAEERPICDLCLLESSSELGMVLALVAVVRAFGAVEPTDHEDYLDALNELGAFARIYERVAAKSSPARTFRIPGLKS